MKKILILIICIILLTTPANAKKTDLSNVATFDLIEEGIRRAYSKEDNFENRETLLVILNKGLQTGQFTLEQIIIASAEFGYKEALEGKRPIATRNNLILSLKK